MPRNRKNQEERIIALMHASWPSWVPAVALSRISLQYGSRIFALRRKGWRISNRTETRDGLKYGYFRLGERPTPHRAKPVSQPMRAPAASLFGDLSPDRSYRE